MEDLKRRLRTLATRVWEVRGMPRLAQLVSEGGGIAPAVGSDAEYIEAIHTHIAECEERELGYIDRYNRLQRDYHDLVGVAARVRPL